MDIKHLKKITLRHFPKGDEKTTLLPNVSVFRRDAASEFEALIYNPIICVVIQGEKELVIGTEHLHLTEGESLLVSHDMPVLGKINTATKKRPYLALIIELDMALIRGFHDKIAELCNTGTAVSGATDATARSVSTSCASAQWIEPMVRYLSLMDDPLEAQVLGPLALTEIHFRLLMSPMGGMLRNLTSVNSHASKIAQTIRIMREHYREPLSMPELAKTVGMSASSFHAHFKAIIGTTPLQYQKHIRLTKAHDLLCQGRQSVSATSYAVGYESPTHFSRDYSRKFGHSPNQAIAD